MARQLTYRHLAALATCLQDAENLARIQKVIEQRRADFSHAHEGLQLLRELFAAKLIPELPESSR